MKPESEKTTRRKRIDARLRGGKPAWKIVRYRPGLRTADLDGVAVEEYPTPAGPADYALFVGGRLLGLIEAKRVGVAPGNVLEQTKRYARQAPDGPGNWSGLRVPFLYASNGETIHFLDVRGEPHLPRELAQFHTPEALAAMFESSPDLSEVGASAIDTPGIRPYQSDAIQSIEAAIRGGRRHILVAMATGTGKTFTTVALIHRLLESKRFRRVLFLVDRRALAMQAVREFASFRTPQGSFFNKEYEVLHQRFQREDFDEGTPFDPKALPESYLTRPDAAKTFVYVSTIQRMSLNLFGRRLGPAEESGDPDAEADAAKLDIPIHAFDLVIADECHRGYTSADANLWREVLQHFDAVKVGLTATPAAHTTAYFDAPAFRYTTEQAILDGHLVDYDPIRVRSEVRMNGAFLKEGELVGRVDPLTGHETLDHLEDEREFGTSEIEKKVTSPESNRKLIAKIAEYAYEHEKARGRFPKTLIFAANDLPHTSHADQLVQICREQFQRGDDFVQKITGNPNVDRPLQRIREFRNRPNPKIVVTVDMLSTGVDIPALEFIVFLRPVKSRILWVQMLGRGTRRCPDILKDSFRVFDCFDGTLFEYFRNATDIAIEAPRGEPMPLAKVVEKIHKNQDREYYVGVLIKRLRRIEHAMTPEGRESLEPFIEDGDVGKFAAELPGRLKDDFVATLKILRDPAFQEALVDAPRAERTFLKGYEIKDEVSAEAMIHAGAAYQKPEDYLESFARFVKEKRDEIAALRILLERPRDWKTAVLDELRKKLAEGNYPEKELRKAYGLVHRRALADIISMVRHAARSEEPILTAEERVERAMARVTGKSKLTKDQVKWLEYIREHLVANLTIEATDLDALPAFTRRGGLKQALKVFGAGLEKLLAELNAAVAA